MFAIAPTSCAAGASPANSRIRAQRSQHCPPRDASMNAQGFSAGSRCRSPACRASRSCSSCCAYFRADHPGFTTPANIANILSQSTILLLLALPMTLIIMTEGLDLSMGAVLTLASIVLAITVLATGSVTLAFLAALAVGLCFGLGNGVLIVAFDIPPFITTLGTLGIAQGLSLLVTDGQSVVGIPPLHRAHLFRHRRRHAVADRHCGAGLSRHSCPALPHALRHLRLRARRQSRGAARRRHFRARHADPRLRLRRRDGGLCRAADDGAAQFGASDRRDRHGVRCHRRRRGRRHLVRTRQRLAARHAARRHRASACCATASTCSPCRPLCRSPASARSSSSRCSSTD